MSGIYVSSGTAEVHVVANGAKAVINTLNHSITVTAHGQMICQVQATTQAVSEVQMRTTPGPLVWLLGRRLTIKVRLR